MVRFIFLCMAVVALSLVTIGAQFLMDDMKDEGASIMARNAEQPVDADVVENASVNEDTFSPESLNQIETTAGGFDSPDVGFGQGGFTNQSPKALGDNTPVAAETQDEAPASN
jgi:hypothetical protein